MGYDLDEGAVEIDAPRWLILSRGVDSEGKLDPSQDAGFCVHSEFSPAGRAAEREAQETYGRAASKDGAAGEAATAMLIAYKAAKLVADVKNITVGGRALTADFDDLFGVLQQKRYTTHRGAIILFARDTDKWRPLDEAGVGN